MKFGVNGLVIDPYNEVDASRSGGNVRMSISETSYLAVNGSNGDPTIFVVAHHQTTKIKPRPYDPPSA